jgi:hypothetical protein
MEMYRSSGWPKHSADTELSRSFYRYRLRLAVITSKSAEASAKFGTTFRTNSVFFLIICINSVYFFLISCIARINVRVK